jgi:hypothetical protein
VRVFDDFLDVREHALRAEYVDWTGYDGQVYKRVALTPVPGLLEAIERVCGPVELFGMGYRLNYANELPNQAVHSDMGWGTHALVLYLCDGPGGTAFWRHKATGAERIEQGDTALMEAIGRDWDDESKWDMTAMCPLKRNRAVIYESALFHSRHPFAAFGDCPENGRLIAVAFFTPRG